MTFNPIRFLDRYQIQYSPTGRNWVNIQCPMCPGGDSHEHGGFNIISGRYNCFKCGTHSTIKIISSLLNITNNEAYQIYKQYEKAGGAEIPFHNPFEKACPTKTCSLPRNSAPLSKSHRKYLEKRSFNPDEIIREWGILGTNHFGKFMKRIIIPIYLDEVLISFTSRDITGQAKQKYRMCSIEDSIISPKDTLYGIDKCKTDRAIICEGPMDVWRIGPGAVSTFGTQFTTSQLLMILEKFNKVYIMFDPDDAGIRASNHLYESLDGFKIDCEIIELPDGKDPGELTRNEAEEYRKLLINPAIGRMESESL